MKKSLSLIILTVVLVVGIAVYFALSKNAADEPEETTAPETEVYEVSTLDPNYLIGIYYEYKDGGYTFNLKDDGTGWLWSENTDLPLATEPFVSMVSGFTELSSNIKLTGVSEEEYERYGLATPTLTVRFLLVDGSVEYRFGIYNSYNGLYYLSKSSDTSTVYMVNGDMLPYFDLTPEDMIADDTIPTPALKKINSLVFKKNGKEYTYTYYPSGHESVGEGIEAAWLLSINGGEEFYPGKEVSDGLSHALEQVKFEERVTFDSEKHTELGLDGSCTLTLNYKEEKTNSTENGSTVTIDLDKSYTLCIGNNAENGLFYAKLDGSILAYTLSPAILGNLADHGSEQSPSVE